MTKASDNAFPSILITEGTEPSAPAAGKQRLYIDSTSHRLMRTNSSGTETDIEGIASAFVGCKVYNSTTQSINNSTDTKATFDTELFDTNTFHDTSSNTSRITIPSGKAGKYLIGGMVKWDTNATGSRNMRVMKNGSTSVRGSHNVTPANAVGPIQETQVIEDLAVGDYVELNVFQTSGGARTIGSASNDYEQTTFWCYLIGT